MRLSANHDDTGYAEYSRLRREGRTITVYLDGREIDHVELCDDQEGIVRCHVLSSGGRIQRDPRNEEEVWTQVLRGDVRIEIGEPGSAT